MRKGLLLLILLAMPFSLCLETKAEGGDTAKANLARTYIEEFILTLRTNHKTLPQIKSAKVRQRVKDQMEILRSGYKATKKKAPSDSDLFDKALRSEFPDAAINEERNSFTQKIQARERQIISRPSARTGESASARDRAKKAVEARMRELGLNG